MADGTITARYSEGIQPRFAEQTKPVEQIAPIEAAPVESRAAEPMTPTPVADTTTVVSSGQVSQIVLRDSTTVDVSSPTKMDDTLGNVIDFLDGLLGLFGGDEEKKDEKKTEGNPVGKLPGTGTATVINKPEEKEEPKKVEEQKKEEPKKTEEPKKEAPKQKMGKPQKFLSVADPHITTADGGKYDNKKQGDFILAKSDSGDLVVQSRQEPIKGSSGIWQTKAAVKTDGNTVQFDAASKTVTINGKNYPFEAGKDIQLPGGGHVKMSKDKFDSGVPYDRLEVFTKDGDKINMLNIQRNGSQYLDISGTVSADRDSGSVKGTVGAMDADTDSSNDMVMRDGKVTKDLDSMLEDWRVRSGESILK
ncbi:VWD domain-containing protein [bacterium]|nr:VWD domain-containing protein [bacterium]